MKKILFIAHTATNGGGSEKVLAELSAGLSKYYEVDVIERLHDIYPFKIDKSADVRMLPAMSQTDQSAKAGGKNPFLNKIKRILLSVRIFAIPGVTYRHYVKGNYDIVISFNYLYSSLLAANAPKCSRKIMWIHTDLDDLNQRPDGIFARIKWHAMRNIQKRAFSQAHSVVAISRRTEESIKQFYPSLGSRLHLIYNGMNLSKIREKSREECSEISENKDVYRFVCVGRVSRMKNIREQCEAIKLLVDEGMDVELHVVGTGDEEASLKKDYAEYVGRNIWFHGFRENPYPFISKCDALVISSFAEGFPTVATEAMSLGKPVLMTPVSGREELITPKTGMKTDWGAENIARGMKAMIGRKFDSGEIMEFSEQYSVERWVSDVRQLIEDEKQGEGQ